MNARIAIIDQGIEREHPRLKNCDLTQVTIHKEGNGNYAVSNGHHDDSSGHGTAIAAIVHGINPDVGLLSVKISTHDKSIKADIIAEAVQYCNNIDDIKVINLSLGIPTEEPPEELYDACKEASDKGKAVVASAYHFTAMNCYPAYFPFVFGVGIGLVPDKTKYAYRENDPINVLAKGSVQRVAWKNKTFRIANGTSYATAHFSGILSNLLEQEAVKDIHQLKKLVKRNASDKIYDLNRLKSGDKQVIEGISREQSYKLKRKLFSIVSRIFFRCV